MNISRNRKKKLIVSYKNLSEDLLEKFKEAYPEGYKDYIQKSIKPNGEPIFVVPFETEEVSYMVKFEVKIDTALLDDDLDKDLYYSGEGDDEEFAPLSEAIEKEENETHHKERVLKHGDYEDAFAPSKIKPNHDLEITGEELEAAFGDEPDEEFDSYTDDEPNEEEDDDFEPSEEDLMDIESSLLEEVDQKPEKASKAKGAKKSTKAKVTTAKSSATKKKSTKK